MKRYAVILAVFFTILSGSAQAQRLHRRQVRAQARLGTTGHFTHLTWLASPSSTNGDCVAPCVVAYNVYRGTVAGGENMATPINPTPLTVLAFDDANVTLGNTYVYVVRAEGFPNGITGATPPVLAPVSNEIAVIFAKALAVLPATGLEGTPN